MRQEQFVDHARAKLATCVAAYALGQNPDEVMEDARGDRRINAVRKLAIYLTYTAFGMSLARCAVVFSRDRSTIAHACQAVENRRDEASFDEWVDGLEVGLKSLALYAPSETEVQ